MFIEKCNEQNDLDKTVKSAVSEHFRKRKIVY